MNWLLLLGLAVGVAIVVWLAFVLFKWLLILAVIATIVWLIAVFRRRAH